MPKQEERWRLFFAVPVTGPAAAALRDWMAEGRRLRPDLKWVEPRHLHLTLRFLGERPAGEVPGLGAVAAEVAARSAPFAVELRGIGGFPSAERARTLWAGAATGSRELAAVAAELEAALLASVPGLEPAHRPFRAHVTLARARSGWVDAGRWPHAAGARQRRWGVLDVEELVLYRSHLLPGGPVYTALDRWRLGGGDRAAGSSVGDGGR